MQAGPYAGRPIPELNDRQLTNFWKKVTRTPGCWVWTGVTTGHMTHSYGRFRVGTSLYVAHRVAWTLHNGPIPDDRVIDHLCGVTLCVNPAHLRLVTQRENVLVSNQERGFDYGSR